VEVCGKRDSGKTGKMRAVVALLKAGWHADGLHTPRERRYCPAYTKNKHL